MGRSRSVRKTLNDLLKKVEALENQSFAQKLLIDELEGKLQQAEATIQRVKDNPFNIPTISTPPVSVPYTPYVYGHICAAGMPDVTGSTHCVACGALMSLDVTYTISSSSSVEYPSEVDTNKIIGQLLE